MAATPENIYLRVYAIDDTSKAFSSVYKNLDQTAKKAKTTQAAVMGTSGGFSTMGRSAGQAGIQVQQLVGQIKGGQDPLLAFSQQATDLGFVLGFPLLGAVAGITAALAGPLIDAVMGVEEETRDLSKEVDTLAEKYETLTDAQRRYYDLISGRQIQTLTLELNAYKNELESLQGIMQMPSESYLESDIYKEQRDRIIELGKLVDDTQQKIDQLANPIAEKQNEERVKSARETADELKRQEDEMTAFFTARLQDKLSAERSANDLLMQQEDEMSEFFTAKLQDRIRQEDEEYALKRTRFEEWRSEYEAGMMQMGDIAISTAATFQSSFGQALEDVFMGTKDVDQAFNDMARTILGQVINSLGQMAAQWITNQILAQTLGATATAASIATATATGAAWAAPAALASLATLGTNAAPAAASIASTVAFSKSMASFDGGGYTGDGARAGGLDGKGGFMAMLHPNETVVDHTKGQSAEAVTVVQNINISTGVAQTVRNEIASMMPQIANASKQAVLDARKRGGSFSNAFGA